MPSTRDIRRRIKSVKNTAQITKAMQLVAASKMKKAQDQAVAGRSYADLLNKVLVNLKEQSEKGAHPLLEEREGSRELMVVVTSDKGLCGGLNTNLLRRCMQSPRRTRSSSRWGSRDRRALAELNEARRGLSRDDPVQFVETKVISRFLMRSSLEERFSIVKVAFTKFINTVTLEPAIETLLPVRPIHLATQKTAGPGREQESEYPSPPTNPDGRVSSSSPARSGAGRHHPPLYQQ